MTTLVYPQPPTTLVDRLRWTVSDGLVIAKRDTVHLIRTPARLFAGLAFPIIQVLLFAYVFGSAIQAPGGGNYREYLMPGLFVQSEVFGLMATTVILASDVSKGVIDRFRSMPMARSALLFGQTSADAWSGGMYLAIMMVCGLVVGWRVHHGILAFLAGFALLVLLRYALSWAGIYLGLALRKPEVADSFVPLVFPVTMIANTFVPTDGMPHWLRVVSDWNPVSAMTAAVRQLFGNPGSAIGAHAALPLRHPIITSVLWCLLILAVFVPLSVRKWRAAAKEG